MINSAITCILMIICVKSSSGKGIDVQKEIDAHSTCNGQSVSFPTEIITDALLAGISCADIEDEYCAKLCVMRDMGGIKGNKLNLKWLKDQIRRSSIAEKNQDTKAQIIKGFDTCGKDDLDMPSPSSRTRLSPFNGKWIESHRVTNCGTWGPAEFCPKGTHAQGVMVKYEELGTTDDNTGINGIALLCSEANGLPVYSKPSSSVAPWGEWRDCHCPTGLFNHLTGFKLCTLPAQGLTDDVSGFGFYTECSISKVQTCLVSEIDIVSKAVSSYLWDSYAS
ncbi:Vitelline membrane outer layer protein 1 [Folsomia candida]|uniref:Vitelline membrane outer layer protein 1 n=1 Tax=Folsomia candida TaxID=158441 RepID=A0A226DP78_FOLCA|nr:Vitelline membrane outer layer protein 1 [Folsomia candida]